MCEEPWLQSWQRRRKHRDATIATWDSGEAREWSRHPGEAQYNPHEFKTDEAIQELELRCVNTGVLISASEIKRTYFLDLKEIRPGVDVGVCNGEVTTIVYAEWHSAGHVHGRPISPGVLDKFLKRARKAKK